MGLKIPEVITEEELKLLVKSMKPHHARAVKIGFYAALRLSEIAGLRKEISVCCSADIIKVKQKGSKQVLKCFKCGAELSKKDIKRSNTEWKIKPLMPENIDEGQGLIRIREGKGGKDRNIPITDKIKYGLKNSLPIKCSGRALEIMFKNKAKDILKKDLHFHCLRHSGLTYLLKSGWNTTEVQRFAGHSRITTTEIYLHINEEDLVRKMKETDNK